MANIQFNHFWNARNRQNIFKIQAMAAVDFEAEPLGQLRAGDDLAQLALPLRASRIAIGAGVDLDAMGAGFLGALDLLIDRIDE